MAKRATRQQGSKTAAQKDTVDIDDHIEMRYGLGAEEHFVHGYLKSFNENGYLRVITTDGHIKGSPFLIPIAQVIDIRGTGQK